MSSIRTKLIRAVGVIRYRRDTGDWVTREFEINLDIVDIQASSPSPSKFDCALQLLLGRQSKPFKTDDRCSNGRDSPITARM